MIRAVDLSNGWAIYAEWSHRDERTQLDFALRHQDGRIRRTGEFASVPEAREVYRIMRLKLDEMDNLRKRPGLDFEWSVLDRATFSLELALKIAGRWSEDLAENEIPDEVAQ